jgi:flagellar biosynthetic protein FliR
LTGTLEQLLAGIGAGQLVAFMLVIARVAPLFIFAPLFSSKMVPVRVRGIIAVALAIGLAPMVLGGDQPPLDALAIAELVLKELVVGLFFAFVIGVLFYALQAAGGFLDTIIGFAFGAAVDPLTGNQGTVVSQFYGLIGVAIFVAIQGDAWVIRGLAETYDLVPLLAMPDLDALLTGAMTSFSTIFTSALRIAAPVMLALILTDVAFGLISRVVPQMNVFAVGMPAKVLMGLLLIGASLPFLAGFLESELTTSVELALSSLGVS